MSIQKKIDGLVIERAAEWFEIYRTGQRERFAEALTWLMESPRHLEQFLAIARDQGVAREVLRSGAVDLDQLVRQAGGEVVALREPMRDVRERGRAEGKRVTRWLPGLAAAVFVIAVSIGLWRDAPSERRQHFETRIGEQRIVPLPDGSVLTLNADSQVEVQMGRAQRQLRLVRGEALFKVAHDVHRPFFVSSGSVLVRAIGTQFNVYARADGSTAVAVVEGRVEVSTGQVSHGWSTGGNSGETVDLNAGELARVDRAGAIEREVKADIDGVVAWRQRRLKFDRAALEDVVAEFNRYNAKLRLKMIGVPKGAYHYTGSFDADDPQSFALLLSQETGLSVQALDDVIVIRLSTGSEVSAATR